MINNFNFTDNLWFEIKPHCINFRIVKSSGDYYLPKDMHFTLSYNSNSPYINFHVTKNIHNELEKPSIQILILDKKNLEENIDTIILKFFKQLIEPININEWRTKNRRKVRFLSLATMDNPQVQKLGEKELVNSCEEIIKRKGKKRVIIKNNFEQPVIKFSNSDFIKDIFQKNITYIEKDLSDLKENGMVIFNKEIFGVVKIGGEFYRIKSNQNPLHLLLKFMKKNTLRKILNLTIIAIKKVKAAESKTETYGTLQ